MIQVTNVSKTYQTKSGIAVEALKDVSLQFKNKGLYFILGKSGSGKTTLLNLISGLDKPTTGTISVYGSPIKDIDAFRNSFVGIVFQENNLLYEFNVKGNVELASKLQGLKSTKEDILSVLEQVEIKELVDRNIDELSGGQKQRVAIARAIHKKSKLLIADEPTGSLDSTTAKSIFSCLKKLSEKQLVIVVTHEEEFAYAYGDEVILLEDGSVKKVESLCAISEIKSQEEGTKRRYIPVISSLKIGLMSMKTKLTRCFLIILLSVFSFTCFGVALATGTYNKTNTILNELKKNDYIDPFAIQTRRKKDSSIFQAYIYPKELEKINQDLDLNLRGVVEGYETKSNFYNRDILNKGSGQEYWDALSLSTLNGYITNADELGFTIKGRYPVSKNEIVIPYYFYQSFKKYGYSYKDITILPEDITEDVLIGKTLILDRGIYEVEKLHFTIVGILDTELFLDGYEDLFQYNYFKEDLERKKSRIETIQICSLHSVGYITEEAVKEYFIEENGYEYLLDKMPNEAKIKQTIFYLDNFGNDSNIYELFNSTLVWIDDIDFWMNTCKYIGSIFGVILALFSGILLFSFINILMKQKEKEMGIFRALGARSRDVFFVFFGDGIFIGLISFLFSLIGTFIALFFLNQEFQKSFQIDFSLYSFSFLHALYMFLLIFAVIFIATAYPILRYTKRPLVELLKRN
ncbi:MAG: ABC transporter ATP-binding protein/permease [Anaeroplasmataceae bacterium]|nr:ABC transporter ATP-binding protein/permease [Anaeroplasmataceae bacterium]